jgi:hypothetical protein
MTGPGANEGELIYGDWEDGPDPEPDKQIEHSCGHIWGYASHEEPPADQPCWRCQPCPCCGEKMWDCTCDPMDPFADEAPE